MTTEDYLEQLQQDKEDLVENLTTMGIEDLTGNETFTELVPEILNIPTSEDTGAYKVNSIAEMNTLTGMNTGDYCVIDTANSLPSSYTGVEYIKSTGTQYINTNYFTKANTVLKLKLKFSNVKIGTNWDNSYKGFISSRDFEVENSYIQINFGSGENQKQQLFIWTKPGQSTNINDVGNRVLDENILSINGTTFSYGDYSNTIEAMPVTTTTPTASLILCASRSAGTGNTPRLLTAYDMHVYGFEIYENDVLIHKYLPCYRNNDNVAGLYDIIGNNFYTNQGTGSFVVGKNVRHYDVYYYNGTSWKLV